MKRTSTTTVAVVLSAAACALSLWRAAAQAPIIQPLALCPIIGQPCPTPEGCYAHQTQSEYYCANMAGSCCQYIHRHYWYKDIVTGETCDPADCVEYTLLGTEADHYCAPSKLCLWSD